MEKLILPICFIFCAFSAFSQDGEHLQIPQRVLFDSSGKNIFCFYTGLATRLVMFDAMNGNKVWEYSGIKYYTNGNTGLYNIAFSNDDKFVAIINWARRLLSFCN